MMGCCAEQCLYLQKKRIVITLELNSNASNTPIWPMCQLGECGCRQGSQWPAVILAEAIEFSIICSGSAVEWLTIASITLVTEEQSIDWT